jgi:hypothetical protein
MTTKPKNMTIAVAFRGWRPPAEASASAAAGSEREAANAIASITPSI